MPKKNNEKGFTLLELLVTLGIITLISAASLSAFQSFFSVKTEAITEEKSLLLQQMFTNIYEDSAWTIDRYAANQGITNSDADTLPVRIVNMKGRKSAVDFTTHPKSNSNADCSGLSDRFKTPDIGGTASTTQGMREYLPSKFDNITRDHNYGAVDKVSLFIDGYGNAFCLFAISHKFVKGVYGTLLPFYEFAIASKGANGVFDTDFNVSSLDSLVIRGDDVVKTISGYKIHEARQALMREKLERVAKAYENFYYAQYLAQPDRSPYLNYFSRPCDTRTPAVRPATNPVRCSAGNSVSRLDNTRSVRDLLVYPNGTASAPVLDLADSDLVIPYPDALAGKAGDAPGYNAAIMRVASFNEKLEIIATQPGVLDSYVAIRSIESNDIPSITNPPQETITGPPYSVNLYFQTPIGEMNIFAFSKLN